MVEDILNNEDVPSKELDNTELLFEDYFWNKVLSHGIDKGFKIVDMSYFTLPSNRKRILGKIIRCEWEFGIPRIAKIPKDDGGVREVYVLSKESRLIGYIMSEIYNWKFGHLISPNCDSYQKGKSTHKTVKEIRNVKKVGVKVDISKYFDNVSIEHINKCLDLVDEDTPIDWCIRDFYNENLVEVDGEFVERYKGLCQGSPLSAFLSNIALRDLDDRLSKVCGFYRRYSDDILALECDSGIVIGVLEEELGKIGLCLNPNKLEFINEDTEFKFLGYGIKGDDILISKKTMKEKKKEIKKICSKSNSLSEAISKINKLLYKGKTPFLNWAYPKFRTITNLDRIYELDRYIKDCLRWSVTGKWNFTHNRNKVPDEMLRDNGYVSLRHMYNLALIGGSIWEQAVSNVLSNIPIN